MDRRVAIALILIFAIALMLRSWPMLLGSTTGPDPFFHARLSEQAVTEQALPKFDELSLQGRYYTYPPLFHLFIAGMHLASSLPVILLISLLPIIYGALAVLLVFVFARRLFNEKVALFSAFSIAVMILHLLRTASYARPDSLALLIIPAIIYLFYTKRFKSAVALAIVLPLLHPLSTMFLLLFLTGWALVFKVLKKEFAFKPALAIIALSTIVFLAWVFTLPYPIEMYLSQVSFESSEMGKLLFLNFFTYFTFAWLFIVVGLFKMQKQLFLKTWFLFALLYGIFAARLAIHLTIPAAMVAGFGLSFLQEKTRPYTSIFFFLLILLATLSLLPHLYHTGKFISSGEEQAMVWLKDHSLEGESVLTQWDKGHPLAYFSERRTVIDGYFEFAPELEERNQASKEMAATADCFKIKHWVRRFNIGYFFIPDSGLDSTTYKNGVLEADDCEIASAVYASDQAKIIQYN